MDGPRHDEHHEWRTNRRRFLAAIGAVGTTTVAGCSGDTGTTATDEPTDTPSDAPSPGGTESTPSATPTDTPSATPTDTPSATSTDTPFPTPPDDAPANGVWTWYARDIPAYEEWLGMAVKVAAIGHGKNNWDAFAPFASRDFPEWVAGREGRIFLPHIPMIPRSENDAVGRGTALRNLAAGEYDDRFRTMAESFESDGFTPETLVLRIGNEFNIEAQPYSPVPTDVTPETWVEGYRRIVETARDVLGEELRTVWAPLIGPNQIPPDEITEYYPGPEYAMVGADDYDKGAPAYDKTNRAPEGIDYDDASEAERETVQQYAWEKRHLKGDKWNDGVGLNDIADLAEEVGRKIAIPEWGLADDGGKWGGGDNSIFIENMYEWMVEHDVAFQAYFEHDTDRVAHELSTGDNDAFPDAAETYRRTFGG